MIHDFDVVSWDDICQRAASASWRLSIPSWLTSGNHELQGCACAKMARELVFRSLRRGVRYFRSKGAAPTNRCVSRSESSMQPFSAAKG
jgi:hypothetical protein